MVSFELELFLNILLELKAIIYYTIKRTFVCCIVTLL